MLMQDYLIRNVQSDATHKGSTPPFENACWLIVKGCDEKYFWFHGEWVMSEIKDPINVFKLIAINKGGKK